MPILPKMTLEWENLIVLLPTSHDKQDKSLKINLAGMTRGYGGYDMVKIDNDMLR